VDATVSGNVPRSDAETRKKTAPETGKSSPTLLLYLLEYAYGLRLRTVEFDLTLGVDQSPLLRILRANLADSIFPQFDEIG
jgi:hypothetical protein